MRTLFDASIISLAQVLLLSLCGLGPAQLLLPARLRAHTLTLAPLVGLALLALIGFYATNAGLTLRQLLPLVLLLALGLLGLAWLRPRALRWPGRLPPRELVPLLLLMFISWLLNIAPVLSYGILIPIGSNADLEFYLPMADYLKDYSYPTLALAPPNPLRDVIRANPFFPRAMGATYAQGLADLLGGWRAWESWVPMLALLRALTLPALYALLREGLGARVGGALAGCALATANSLLLWTTYNSFGMSTAGLALLPLALLCTLLALEGMPRAVGSAALLLGALSCTYWPMLLAYGAGALGFGLALLLERRRGGWSWVVGRGVLVLAGGGLLGLLAHLRAPVAFITDFTTRMPSMGILSFIPPPVIAGSAPLPYTGVETGGAPASVLAWAGLAVALALLARGVWRGTARPGLALALALCCLLYLLGLRFIVRYPYGFLRGASYINTLLLGLIGAGLLPQKIEDRGWRMEDGGWRHPPSSILHPPLSVLAALLLATSTALASYRIYAAYAPEPVFFRREAAELRAVAAGLHQPGPIFFSASAASQLCGSTAAAWAYALWDRELLGVVKTAYSDFDNSQPGVAPAYSLLRRGEDPRDYGLDRAALVWQNEDVALYAAPDRRLAWLNGRPGSYGEAPLCQRDATTYQRAQLGVGSYLQAQPDQPLVLYAGEQELSLTPLPSAPPAPRELRLALGSFITQTVEIELGNERRLVELPAGATIYATGIVSAPLRVTLRGRQAPLTLRWASLDAPDRTQSGAHLQAQDEIIMLGVESEVQTANVTAHLEVQNSGDEVLRLAVEIYTDLPGYRVEPVHYAWALFPAPQPGPRQLALDLAAPAASLDGAPLPLQVGDLRDGSYFAALWVYQGEQVRKAVPFLRFERRGGVVSAVTPLDLNAGFVALDPPAQPLAVTIGEGIGLRGYELSTAVARPGERARLSLLWQAGQAQQQLYLVFAQVLDDADRKIAQWDGAVGGDWWPTPVWRAGQRIWQDVPLAVAADAPPGRYRVIVGVYDPATGQRLRLADGSDALLLTHLEVQP